MFYVFKDHKLLARVFHNRYPLPNTSLWIKKQTLLKHLGPKHGSLNKVYNLIHPYISIFCLTCLCLTSEVYPSLWIPEQIPPLPEHILICIRPRYSHEHTYTLMAVLLSPYYILIFLLSMLVVFNCRASEKNCQLTHAIFFRFTIVDIKTNIKYTIVNKSWPNLSCASQPVMHSLHSFSLNHSLPFTFFLNKTVLIHYFTFSWNYFLFGKAMILET